MAFTSDVRLAISTLVLLSDAFIIIFLLVWGLRKAGLDLTKSLLARPWGIIKANGLQLALLVAIVSMAGSLFFSDVMMFTPCKLCWIQRIFMYPLVVIFAVALKTHDKDVHRYVYPMAGLGALFAGYHYVSQMGPTLLHACGVGAEDCTVVTFAQYGYITIPIMALTGFILIILFTCASRRK